MFEKYLALITTLKTEKYSVLVHQARENILAALQTDTFSRRLRGVLESKNFALSGLSVQEILQLKTLIGNQVPKIAAIDAEGEYKAIAFTPDEIDEIRRALDRRLYEPARKLRAKFVETDPFTHYAEEPAQISQIKKIINALYHAEKALIDLESITYSLKDLKVVTPTIEHIYEAAMLATHIDLDLGEIFGEELKVLTVLQAKFKSITKEYNQGATDFLSKIDVANIPHEIGFAGGVLVDQLGAKSGEVDYKFITQISAAMPKYIDKLTGYIHEFSSAVSVHEPTIDKIKLQALENEALKLLHALETMQGSSLWLPLKTLHFIRIIRHTITLSISIFQQIGFLNEKSQVVVCDNLAILKYKLLPELLGLSDKLEEHALLKPGFLSDPILQSVSKLYEALTGYAGILVDFSQKGTELVILNDAAFVEARLALTFKRMANNQQKYSVLDDAEEAATQFFNILSDDRYKKMRVSALEEDVRDNLIRQYKLFQPFVLAVDVPWNNIIIGCLLGKKDILDNLLTWLGLGGSTTTQDILSKFKPLLMSWFIKARNTNQFYDVLCFDTVISVSKYANDFNAQRKNPLRIEETYALGIDITQSTEATFEASALTFESTPSGNQLQNPQQLNVEQSSRLVQYYGEKQVQLNVAHQAYRNFHHLLVNNPMVDDTEGNDLRGLYSLFQPYLTPSDSLYFNVDVLKQLHDGIVAIISEPGPGADVTMIQRLRALFASVFSVSEADALGHLNIQMNNHFEAQRQTLMARFQVFERTVKADVAQKSEQKELVQDLRHAARAYHLIKHERFSKTMTGVRVSLLNLIKPFNTSVKNHLYNPFMQAQVKADKAIVDFNKDIDQEKDKKQFKPFSQLPFPELLDVNQRLAESSQVLGLKQLFNCTYHLEQASLALEKLSDKDSKLQYVQTVYAMGTHLQEARSLALALMGNPGLVFIKNEVMAQLKKGYALLLEVHTHYFPSGDDELEQATVEHDALFYVLNSLMILPEHIAVLREGNALSLDKTSLVHKHAEKVTADIERIIRKSSSYFKLFFEIPTMFKLFGDLKTRLVKLAAASHDVVFDNLSDINEKGLTTMLIEADRWEDTMGLLPGTLTSPLKKVFDTFYQGLLQPLGLPSKKHLSLVASLSSVEQRRICAISRADQAALEQEKIKESRLLLERLLERIKAYKACSPKSSEHLTIKDLMIDDFKTAVPILITQKHLIENISPEKNSEVLDALFNSTEHGIVNVEGLINASFNHFKGLHASYQLTRDTVKEKIIFLDELTEKEVTRKEQYIENYTRASFERQSSRLASKQVGFVHCMVEYSDKLKDYMKTAEEKIVHQAKSAEDIDHEVAELLREKGAQFEKEHYKNYHHLENVMAVIGRLNAYLYKSNMSISKQKPVVGKERKIIRESESTLAPKNELAIRLNKVANDQTMSVEKRLQALNEIVMAPSFKTQIERTCQHDKMTWKWICQCILSLVELLGLYTPERKKCYRQLVKAVAEPTTPFNKLSQQYGLFSSSARSSVSAPEVPPEKPAPAPQG